MIESRKSPLFQAGCDQTRVYVPRKEPTRTGTPMCKSEALRRLQELEVEYRQAVDDLDAVQRCRNASPADRERESDQLLKSYQDEKKRWERRLQDCPFDPRVDPFVSIDWFDKLPADRKAAILRRAAQAGLT